METDGRTKQVSLLFMPRRILYYAKIVQGECRTKQTCLFFMPSRSLSYQNIAKVGSKTKKEPVHFFVLPKHAKHCSSLPTDMPRNASS